MSRRSDEAPVVGVTAARREVRYGAWEHGAALVPADYLDMLGRAGALPVLLSPAAGVEPERAAALLVERVDALLLTGGVDMDPARYGQEAHGETQQPDSARDAFEAALLARAADAGLPVLAVCRGVQVLNVARGGTLHQHLPDVVGHSAHLPVAGQFARHHVRVEPGSRLAAALGATACDVPTHHHQAVDAVGRDLVPTAWAEDGVVEALEDPGAAFLVGVQWHPEAGDDPSLFAALVAAAGAAPQR